MAIKDTLQDSKNRLDSLLDYANGVTGKEDTSLGDAVKTLCDGYGQGDGGSREVFHATFTPEARVYTSADNVIVGRMSNFDKNKIYHIVYKPSQFVNPSVAAPLTPFTVTRQDIVASASKLLLINNVYGVRNACGVNSAGTSGSILTANLYANSLLQYITDEGDVRFITFTQAAHGYLALPVQHDIYIFEEE